MTDTTTIGLDTLRRLAELVRAADDYASGAVREHNPIVCGVRQITTADRFILSAALPSPTIGHTLVSNIELARLRAERQNAVEVMRRLVKYEDGKGGPEETLWCIVERARYLMARDHTDDH